MGIRRQNRAILSREAWLCLEIYRVSVESWNVYLLGSERNVGVGGEKNKGNCSEGSGKKREESACAVPSDTARERYEEEEGVLRGAEETPPEKWKRV